MSPYIKWEAEFIPDLPYHIDRIRFRGLEMDGFHFVTMETSDLVTGETNILVFPLSSPIGAEKVERPFIHKVNGTLRDVVGMIKDEIERQKTLEPALNPICPVMSRGERVFLCNQDGTVTHMNMNGNPISRYSCPYWDGLCRKIALNEPMPPIPGGPRP